MVKVAKLTVKRELMMIESVLKVGKKLAPEHSAQDANGQKEPIRRRHPVLPVGAEASARDHAVQVRMSVKVLPPGVEHRQTADLGAEVFRVSGDPQQCLGSGTEHHPVHDTAILKR
jgi:hypothetical protein